MSGNANEPNVALAWMRAVRDSTELASTTKLVLLILGMRMDPDGGNCYPSTRTIAEETGLSRKAVEKHLRIADEDGWIDRRSRERDENVRWRSDQYFPRLPTLGNDVTQAPGEPASPSNGDLGEPHSMTLGNEVPTTSSYTSSEDHVGGDRWSPPGELEKDESGNYVYPSSFEDIWSTYPRRKGKKAAYRKVRARVNEGVDPDRLQQAAESYRRRMEREGRDAHYIKLAATFFGPDDHWREELEDNTGTGKGPVTDLGRQRAALDVLDGGMST